MFSRSHALHGSNSSRGVQKNAQPAHLHKTAPGRVAQAMGGVFAVIGTPTSAPKPRGKSAGWEAGKKRHRKNRCPIVKKRVTPPRKEPSVAV